MPALVCNVAEAATLTSSGIKKRQQHQSIRRGIFDLPELCDLIACHLDRHTLTIIVRVSSQWYSSWIRHLWKMARVESGSAQSLDMVKAFPRLSQHIRQLEWIHLSEPTRSLMESTDLSMLNVQSLLLSSWSSSLDASTLYRFVQSSAHRLSALQLHNMAHIRGDLLKVAGALPNLQYLSLTMADREVPRNHSRQRTSASTSSELTVASPSSPTVTTKAESTAVTSPDSLPDLFEACPQMRMIELLDFPSSSNATQDAVVTDLDPLEEGMEPVMTNWRPMQHLTIINLHGSSISGSTLSTLFARCPQLVKLNLSQTLPLYLTGFCLDPSLILSELSSLLLAGCHFLDGQGYKEIFKATPNLLTLEIPQTNVDDAALVVLGHQCPKITDLSLDGCPQITDQGIRDMLSYRPQAQKIKGQGIISALSAPQPYQNRTLQCLSVSNCSELTGQGVHHILMTCAGLRRLEIQQPEIMPESLFPHTLATDDEEEQEQEQEQEQGQEQEQAITSGATLTTTVTLEMEAGEPTTLYQVPGLEPMASSPSWACCSSLELLQIKNLNFINQNQTQYLNARLRELTQLKVLHIGGSQLELSILNGLGHLENLYIDDLAREVGMEDVRWLVDHTPNLTRLWCRQLIRHSEPWKLLRGARKHLKLW